MTKFDISNVKLKTIMLIITLIFIVITGKERKKLSTNKTPRYEIKVVDPDKVVSIKLTSWEE